MHKLLRVFFLLIITIGYSQSKSVISGNVSDKYSNLPGAKIIVEGSEISTTTDAKGKYTLELDPGQYNLLISFLMYDTQSRIVTVIAGVPQQIDFKLKTGFSIDQPVSLGSRAKPKTSLKNTAAVDIISPEEISNSSQIELSHILHFLLPSFHSTHQTIADGTDHVDPATLRGLGPDQILVFVNGKRRHSSSLLNVNGTLGRGTVGTDFNAIPIASIDRIEILRDGATSQYGSDAIAGVINIILKKQTDVINIDNRVSVNTEGDGLTTYSGANFGLKMGEKGFLNVTAEYRQRESVNRAGDYNGTVYSEDIDIDTQLIAQNNFFGQTGYSGKRVMEIGSAETQNLGIHINGEMPFSKTSSFYFHGGKNYREGKAKGFYRFPKDEAKVVLELFPNGFSPQILTDIQDDAIVAGVKGKKNGWDVDFSHGIGKNRLDYTINNSNNASLGLASPSTFYAGGFQYNQNTTNLDMFKIFDWLNGVNIAFGGELRVENYQISEGEEASWINGGETYTSSSGEILPRIPGAQVFPGFENGLSKFRTNSSAYLDAETSVTDKLLVKTAARYELYNDFGGQLIWKLSGRYAINEDFTARAGIATGFRAPSLHQVFFQNISTQFVSGESIQVGTFNNESPVAEAFDIEKLKPELSQHFNIGINGKIGDNLTFGVDYYMIKIKDRIVLSGRFDEGYESILEPLNVGAAQFFTNAVDTRTSGIEGALAYRTDLGIGKLETSLAANLVNTKVVGKIKVPDALLGQEEVLFNREEVSRVESAQPNYKVISKISYGFDKFQAHLTNSLFGEVKFVHPHDGDPNNWALNELSGSIESRDQAFAPKLVTDMALSYQFNNYIRLTFGGNNVFNVYPDEHTHSSNIDNGNFIYSRRVQQFGVNGANYYLRVLLKL